MSHVQSEVDRSKELMQMLGVSVPTERVVRAAAVRWYGHVLQKKEDNNVLKETLNFKVIGIGRRKKRKIKGNLKNRLKL